MPQAVLALGSNISPAKENIDRAVEALSALGTVKEVAPYIVSKPEGFAEQADFVNTVLILSTPYQPLPPYSLSRSCLSPHRDPPPSRSSSSPGWRYPSSPTSIRTGPVQIKY